MAKWVYKKCLLFLSKMWFFSEGSIPCLTFYDGIKTSVASKVLIMTIKEKPSKLLTLVTALVCWKYKTYIFYGVSICNKQSSIVNIKEGIIYDDRRNTISTINTCDGFCASKIQNIYFLWCYYLGQILFHHLKKNGISDKHEAIENGKILWRENSPLTFHICDYIYPSQLISLLL